MTIEKNTKYLEWENCDHFWGVISFFTPTYNRAHLLRRVYSCLEAQTDRSFVWIVVNDGSKDNTEDVIHRIMSSASFPILYISKGNGGKHSAFKAALQFTDSEFFVCMDDDDVYSQNSVEVFLNEWRTIVSEGKVDQIGAVRALTIDNGKIVSGHIAVDKNHQRFVDQTTLESNYKKHEYFENWTCYRTDALHQIELFPNNYWLQEHHFFFSESIWQGRFARKFLCRYIFIVLREYRHDTQTSIIRSNKSRQHYFDMFVNTKMILDEQLDYVVKSPVLFSQYVLIVSILRKRLGIPLKELLLNTPSLFLKVLYVFFAPSYLIINKPQIQN